MPRVVALAGRRIDAPGAVARFPLENAGVVRERLRALLIQQGAEVLVCSAACGADLLALEVAGSLRLRRRVVLPFGRERFRETSVTDRPGDWDPVFDRVIDAVAASGDLVVLEGAGEGNSAYAAVTEAILHEAIRLGRGDRRGSVNRGGTAAHGDVLAVIVWEGQSRGEGDLTARFAELATGWELPLLEVLTA